jgi:HPt (histidine-containing phosphotransfer) domain-containing protein
MSRGLDLTAGGFVSPHGSPHGIPAIDRSVLGEWLAGDEAAIDELLAVFRESIFAEQERMREALAHDALGEYAGAAHRLRGAALSMGAHALAKVAGTLNAAAQALDETACRDGLSVLETHVCLMAAEIPLAAVESGGRSQET